MSRVHVDPPAAFFSIEIRSNRSMSTTAQTLTQCMKRIAKPLPPIDSASFGETFDWLGQYDTVLMGDTPHGTSEFYAARAEITKRLVQHRGFKCIALEADWPDAEAIDHYVGRWPGQHPDPIAESKDKDSPFQRSPPWMWRESRNGRSCTLVARFQ